MTDIETIKKTKHFIEDILDGMYDWVRVIDRDDNVIYMNKAMSENLKDATIGAKCYESLGRTKPCKNCISRKSVFDGEPHVKEEIIEDKVFSVMSSPIKNENREVLAIVEVMRDTTQVKRLQMEILKQNSKMRDDLAMALKLQCSLLPVKIPEDKVNFSYVYKPCDALGGDFLDIFKIDESHIGFYVADVSGHGVSASMLTVFLRSSFNKKLLSPSQVLKELFREFNNINFENDLYITIFYGILDLNDNTMIYSNAGHNVSPVVIGENKAEFLRHPGIPISNWLADPGYTDGTVRLQKGDSILFYTDGIIEMRNPEKEQFGEDRLLKFILSSKKDFSEVLNELVDTAIDFTGKDVSELTDDITVALLGIK